MLPYSNGPHFNDNEYDIKILLQKDSFQDYVLKLRKKWDIPDEGFATARSHRPWQLKISNTAEGKLYNRDITHLILTFNLTERWRFAISQYIQLNAPHVLRLRSREKVRVDYYDPEDEESIKFAWIQVDRDTTQREVIEDFNTIKGLFKNDNIKKQPPKNLDRDIRAYEMHIDGSNNKDIATWLSDNFDGAFGLGGVRRTGLLNNLSIV